MNPASSPPVGEVVSTPTPMKADTVLRWATVRTGLTLFRRGILAVVLGGALCYLSTYADQALPIAYTLYRAISLVIMLLLAIITCAGAFMVVTGVWLSLAVPRESGAQWAVRTSVLFFCVTVILGVAGVVGRIQNEEHARINPPRHDRLGGQEKRERNWIFSELPPWSQGELEAVFIAGQVCSVLVGLFFHLFLLQVARRLGQAKLAYGVLAYMLVNVAISVTGFVYVYLFKGEWRIPRLSADDAIQLLTVIAVVGIVVAWLVHVLHRLCETIHAMLHKRLEQS